MSDPIVLEGNPVLRQKAAEVSREMFGTKELTGIVYRMAKALRGASNGVAIAAPQIGNAYRIFVVRGFVMQGRERNDIDIDVAFINPVITKHSRKKVPLDGEGCLSVPDVYGTVERYDKATVRAYDVHGKMFERGGAGLLAEIFQHEVDHLNGTLFIDKASNLKKAESETESVIHD